MTGATVTAASKTLPRTLRRWIVDEPVSVYRDPARRPSHALGTASPNAGDEPGGAGRDRGDRPIRRRCAHRARARPHRSRSARSPAPTPTRALHNLRLAQDAADGLLGEVADVDLADIPQMEPVRQRLLEKARAGYQQFLVEEGDDPLVRWGAVPGAGASGRYSGAARETCPRPKPRTVSRRLELEGLAKRRRGPVPTFAATWRSDLHGLGVLLKDANRFQEGEAKLREAIRLREEIAKLPDATTRRPAGPGRQPLPVGGASGSPRRRPGPRTSRRIAAALEVEQSARETIRRSPRVSAPSCPISKQPRDAAECLGNSPGVGIDAPRGRSSCLLLRSKSRIRCPARGGSSPASPTTWARCFSAGRTRRGGQRTFAGLRVSSASWRPSFPPSLSIPSELASVEYNLGIACGEHASSRPGGRVVQRVRHDFSKR